MNRRLAKVNEAIRESVSTTVLFNLKDPRVKNVTVLRADASPDLRQAKVYISVRGDEKDQALSMHGLNAARGFIQHKLAERIQTKNTPILTFVLDRGVQLTATASAIFNQLTAELPSASDGTEAAEPSSEGDDAAQFASSVAAPAEGEQSGDDEDLSSFEEIAGRS